MSHRPVYVPAPNTWGKSIYDYDEYEEDEDSVSTRTPLVGHGVQQYESSPSLLNSETRKVGVFASDSRGCVTWLLNIVWAILAGGLAFAILWCIVGVAMCISVILYPFGLQCFKVAKVALLPFGQQIYSRSGCCECRSDLGTWHLVGNILWLPIGLCFGVLHILYAVLTALTIIGLPFSYQHVKLASLALWPFGTEASSYSYMTVDTMEIVVE
eukprot:TRINITY_DN4494_c3_g1_i1.p1 TRINITY_DN4494_c3_g1~~TRINITY_DN4494_c3_g1_i1.p1  ORF type:complete len:213 (+),score=23.19 TRINITY_DN4494_c3_g1_i1:288-926(+)